VKINLTLPAEAGGIDDAYITVGLHAQNPSGTDIFTINKRIYYDETASGTQDTELYMLIGSVLAAQFTRIKVDWTAHSGAFPPTAVKVTMIRFWTFQATITSTTLQSST